MSSAKGVRCKKDENTDDGNDGREWLATVRAGGSSFLGDSVKRERDKGVVPSIADWAVVFERKGEEMHQ